MFSVRVFVAEHICLLYLYRPIIFSCILMLCNCFFWEGGIWNFWLDVPQTCLEYTLIENIFVLRDFALYEHVARSALEAFT